MSNAPDFLGALKQIDPKLREELQLHIAGVMRCLRIAQEGWPDIAHDPDVRAALWLVEYLEGDYDVH